MLKVKAKQETTEGKASRVPFCWVNQGLDLFFDNYWAKRKENKNSICETHILCVISQ